MALVATAALIEAHSHCGEDTMTACEVMAEAGKGRPRGDKARRMMASIQSMGCEIPQWMGRDNRAEFMQGMGG